MSTFPTAGTDLDRLITETRAKTPPAVLEKRSVPRLSIAELNQADPEELKSRFLASNRDSRTPLTKVLDLIDAPRNAVLNVLATSIAKERVAQGETGAFGLGRVNTSDVLRHLGVSNNVAAGILGFVGDVALDPLTYVGPPGWGAELGRNITTQGVRSFGLRGAGNRALTRSITEHAAGQAVKDPHWGKVIGEALAEHPDVAERLTALRAAGDAAGAESALAAHLKGPLESGAIGQAFSRVGGELAYGDGYLTRKFSEPTANSVKEAVAKYGKGTEPGLRIGLGEAGAGSAIAHIPFTDISLQVPAFTKAANNAVRSLWIANDARGIAQAVRDGSPEAKATWGALLDGRAAFEAQNEEIGRLMQAEGDFANDLPALKVDHDLHRSIVGEGVASPLDDEMERLALTRAASDAKLAELTDRMQASADTIKSQMEAINPAAYVGNVKSANDYLHIERAYQEAQKVAESARQRLDFFGRVKSFANLGHDSAEMPHLSSLLAGDQAEWKRLLPIAQEKPEEFAELMDSLGKLTEAQDQYATILKGQIGQIATGPESALRDLAKQALGTDDDAIASSLFGSVGRLIERVAGDDNGASRVLRAMDRHARLTLNARGGYQAQKINAVKAELRGAHAMAELVKDRKRAAIGKALADAGLSPKGEMFDRAIQLVHAKMYQAVGEKGPYYYTTKFGSGGDSDLIAALKELQADGIFSEKVHPGLMARLGEIAAGTLSDIQNLGLAEQADDLLELPMAGYIPIGFSEPGREARNIQSQLEVRARSRGAGTEPFQRPRTTWQTRFKDADGTERRFFEFQREFAGMDDEALAKLFADDADGLSRATEARDAFAAFDALPEEVQATYRARATDPWELNALWREGTFNRLVGTNRTPEALFDLDITSREAIRLGQHQRAVAKRGLLDLAKANARVLSGDALERVAQAGGREAMLSDGVRVQVLPGVKASDGNVAAAVKIGDQTFRRLSSDTIGALNQSLLPIAGHDLKDMVFWDKFADKFEDMVRSTLIKEKVPTLLAAADKITSLWKELTLFRPAWMVNNIVGDLANAWSGGADIKQMLAAYPDLVRLRWAMNDPESLSKLSLKIAGQTMSGPEAVNFLIHHRAFNESQAAEFAAHVFQGKADLRGIHSAFKRKFVAPWFRANAFASDVQRAAAFISHMEQGNDAVSASRKMLDSLLDYADFSHTEERYFRRLIPFYSWIRGNLGYQAHALVQRPIYAAMAPKLKQALEEATAGEAAVPEHLRPSWMRDQLATQIGKDPNKRFSIMLGNGLPPADIYNALTPIFGVDGALQFMHYFTSNISPQVTVPLQLGAGVDFYTGKTIGADSTKADLGAGEFLGQQIMPIAELGPGGRIWKAAEQGPGSAIARALVGGRAQTFDQDRLSTGLKRQYDDEERRLRAAVTRSERDGDHTASLAARVRLMKMYQERASRGLEIPKWAREELDALQTPALATP